MAKNKAQEKFIKTKNKVSSSVNTKNEHKFEVPILNTAVIVLCIAIAVGFSYKGYLETRVNTPYDVEKVSTFFIIYYFKLYIIC